MLPTGSWKRRLPKNGGTVNRSELDMGGFVAQLGIQF